MLKHNIIVDGALTHGKDKVDLCIKNNIDIMIDDSRYNYDRLVENNIKTILFDEENKNKDVVNRISSWKDILNKIEEFIK